jgi:FkbM family methyltransferase
VWALVPGPLKGPAHRLIALGRRFRARSTPLPDGSRPPLPASAVELKTLQGEMWFDGDDLKLTPWVREHATWEADLIRLLDAHVKPGMTVVDVGANVGFLTVVLAQLVGDEGHVHAFEPLPETLEILRANVWRHRAANVTVHPQAVSDRDGTVHVAPDPKGRSGAALAEHGFEVQAVTLDGALAGARVDVLKVDVEGAEPLVLAGAQRVLAASPDLLAVVEFRPETHLDGSTPEQVLARYTGLGFRLQLLHADGSTHDAGADDVLAAARANETINLVLRRA